MLIKSSMGRMISKKKEAMPPVTKILFQPLLILFSIVVVCCIIYLPMNYGPHLRPPDSSWMLLHRDLRQYVLPNNDTIIVEPKLSCTSNTSSNLFLVVVVCSSVPNFVARQSIRETWGKYRSETVKVFFLLGKSENDTLNAAVVEENELHYDIIQQDFIDTYNNLTVKSTILLKWIVTYCQNAQYIMKTDDDMFVNLPNLITYLKNNNQSNLLLGCLISKAVPIKDWHSKWYVPDGVFLDHVYPNYLSGTGYVMSNDTVPKLYKTALNTPLFYLEDIFITGICAHKIGLKPVNNIGFKFHKRKNDPCIFRKIITSHHMSVTELHDIWVKMNKPSIKCITKQHNSNKKS